MADQTTSRRRRGSWRGRLTVLGLFALGLLALVVLQLTSEWVARQRAAAPAAAPK